MIFSSDCFTSRSVWIYRRQYLSKNHLSNPINEPSHAHGHVLSLTSHAIIFSDRVRRTSNACENRLLYLDNHIKRKVQLQLHVTKSKMEWKSFKALFEVAPSSRSPHEGDGGHNFSMVGAHLYLDHASGILYSTDGFEVEPPQSASREPSGLGPELEMEPSGGSTSGRSICVGPTRSSLGGAAHDDSRETSERSADCIVHDWSRDEIISSDEALDSETGYKTAAPSSSLELDDQIVEERAASCVDLGNGENERAKDLDNENEIKQHLRWFGHGKLWTLIAVFVSWAGVILAFYSRYSLHFVALDEPLLIDSGFNDVDSVGMLRTEICYNESVVGENGCQVIDLSPEIVDEIQFEAARILLTLGLLFGTFFATVLSTAIGWESINLRPIRFGLLLTCFIQSCAMIFFDTDLCATSKCRPGPGCVYCIVASFCWITACIATAEMDKIKSGLVQRRQRQARRERRQARKEAKKTAKAIRKKRDRETRKKRDRETLRAAEQTASTSPRNSGPHVADV
jgi:hypothetical protein